ncbi:MAG: flippase [Candidatus Limnocylindria bacterium]
MAQDDLLVAAKGGGIVFLGRVFAWGSRFALAVLVARVLGAAEYGLYNLAIAGAAIVSAFAIVGLDAALVRYVAVFAGRKDWAGMRGALQFAVGLPAALAAVLALTVVAVSDPLAMAIFNEPDLGPLIRLSGILIPALILNQLFAATLQGLKQIHSAVLAEQIAQQVLRFAFLLAFLLFGLSAWFAMLATTLAAVGVTVLLAFFVVRALPRGTWAVATRSEGRTLLGFSLPVWLSNVVNTLGANLQTTLLGVLSTASAVGIFTIANQVTMLGSMFHMAIVAASMPLFAGLHDRGDRPGLERLYRTTSKWTLAVNLPLFLILVAFPSQILSLFGPEFRVGAAALAIMAWASLVNAATGTSGAILDMTGYTRLKLVNSTVAVGLGVGLNFVLIPPLGLIGAAIAAVSAITIVNVMRLVEVRILLHVSPYDRSYAKPIAAGLAALAASLVVGGLLQAPAGIEAAVGIVVITTVYVGVTVKLGLTADDRMIVSRAWARMRRKSSTGRPRSDDRLGTAKAKG